ncbi:MAG: hypothetical protein ABIR53_06160 [Paraperlucidibaca sp.]
MTATDSLPAKQPAWVGGFDEHVRWGLNTSADTAYWLQQYTVVHPLRRQAQLRVALALFSRQGLPRVHCLHDGRALVGADLARWRERGDWAMTEQSWPSGSFLSERDGVQRARFFGPDGQAQTSSASVLQVPQRATLRSPLGALKAQAHTRDGQWLFTPPSKTAAPALGLDGRATGGQWQCHSRLAAMGSAQLQCVDFDGQARASVVAMGQWLAPAVGRRAPMTIVQAQVSVGGRDYRFDRWLPNATTDAPEFDDYRWIATLVNDDFRLHIHADGGNPRITPWLELSDARNRWLARTLRVTPFASLRLRIYPRGSEQAYIDLRSEQCLLQTVLP